MRSAEEFRRHLERLLWPQVREGDRGAADARRLVAEVLDLAYLAAPSDWFAHTEEREAVLAFALDRIVRRNRPRLDWKVRPGVAPEALDDHLRSCAFERADLVFGSLDWFLVGFSEEELDGFRASWSQRVGDDTRGPGWRTKYEVAWPRDGEEHLRDLPEPSDPLDPSPKRFDIELVEEMAARQVERSVRQQIEDLLSPRQHEVFWLHHGESRSHAEIAEALGISPQHSRDLKAQAWRRLRERLVDPRSDCPPT